MSRRLAFMARSPLPFGVHRFPRWLKWVEMIEKNQVSIAFRRSPLSPRAQDMDVRREGDPVVSIAFRRSPLSPQAKKVGTRKERMKGLHCLSAFTAFPARYMKGI